MLGLGIMLVIRLPPGQEGDGEQGGNEPGGGEGGHHGDICLHGQRHGAHLRQAARSGSQEGRGPIESGDSVKEKANEQSRPNGPAGNDQHRFAHLPNPPGGLLVQPVASEDANDHLKRQPEPDRHHHVYYAQARCGANQDHGSEHRGGGEMQPLGGLPARKANQQSQPALRQQGGRMISPARGSMRSAEAASGRSGHWRSLSWWCDLWLRSLRRSDPARWRRRHLGPDPSHRSCDGAQPSQPRQEWPQRALPPAERRDPGPAQGPT